MACVESALGNGAPSAVTATPDTADTSVTRVSRDAF